MAWNINYGAIQAALGGSSAPATPAPPAPAPAAPPAYDFNATLPGNSGGASSPSGGGNPTMPAPSGGSAPGVSTAANAGGEVNLDFETFKTKAASDAAYAAYLAAKSQNDTEETAIHKAVAEANRVYQEKTVELQTRQLAETQTARLAGGAQNVAALQASRAAQYTTAQGQFAHGGVATRGAISGLNALRAPLPPALYASMLGLDQNDPRATAIAQAAQSISGASPGSGGSPYGSAAPGPYTGG